MRKSIITFIYFILLYPIVIIPQETESFFDWQSSFHYFIGFKLMGENKIEEAFKHFQLSINQNEPEFIESIIRACECQKMLNNYREAIKYCKKALKYQLEDGKKGRVYELLGYSYGFLEDYKTAFQYFNLMKQASDLYDIPDEFIFIKDGWYFIAHSEYDYIYYNKSSVKNKGRGTINIWLKWYWDEIRLSYEDYTNIYNNDISYDYSSAINKRIKEVKEERKNVKYSLCFYDYDFVNRRYRLLELIKYDTKGRVIESFSWQKSPDNKIDSNWNSIVPGSVGEIIFNTLKRKFNK